MQHTQYMCVHCRQIHQVSKTWYGPVGLTFPHDLILSEGCSEWAHDVIVAKSAEKSVVMHSANTNVLGERAVQTRLPGGVAANAKIMYTQAMNVLRRGRQASKELNIAFGEFKNGSTGLVPWLTNTKTLMQVCGVGQYPLTLTHLRLLFLADVLSLLFVQSNTNQMRGGQYLQQKLEKGHDMFEILGRNLSFDYTLLWMCVISVINVRVKGGCVRPAANPKRIKVNGVSAPFPPMGIWTVSMTYQLLHSDRWTCFAHIQDGTKKKHTWHLECWRLPPPHSGKRASYLPHVRLGSFLYSRRRNLLNSGYRLNTPQLCAPCYANVDKVFDRQRGCKDKH